MKRFRIWMFVTLIPLVLLCLGCSSSTTDESEVNGFYFSFDELGNNGELYEGQITDRSGNNFHGYSDSVSGVPGKVGRAASFIFSQAGSIQLQEIESYFPFETGFTFRAWIWPFSINTSQPQQIIGSTRNRVPGSGGDGFGIGIIMSFSRLSIIYDLPETETYDYFISPSLSLYDTDWVHIALTYDGENLSFYFNGDLVGTETVLSSFNQGFYNHIGNMPDANSNGFPRNQFFSVIDELYLENRVMSSEQIMTYYLDTL